MRKAIRRLRKLNKIVAKFIAQIEKREMPIVKSYHIGLTLF